MSAPSPTSARLERLLAFLAADADNLALRKDAIREACSVGRWDTALDLIQLGLQSHPAEAGLLALLGFTHLQALRYEDAEATLRAALAQGIDAPEVQYNLAFATFMQGNYAQALESLTPQLVQVVSLALLLRARCLHHLGRHAEAVAACKAHLVIAPDHAETQGLLALLLYEQGALDEANAYAVAALERNPAQLDAMLTVSSIHLKSLRYDTARQSFDRLLQTHPRCGRAWLESSLLELSRKQLEAARRDAEIAAACMPEHIGTWHALAWIQILLGDISAAQLAFTHACALDRSVAETHGGLAVVAVLQGQEDEARLCIKRSLRLDPAGMSAQYAQLLLLQHQGKYQEALSLLDAFLARPLPNGDFRQREILTAQVDFLRAHMEGQSAAPGVSH